MFGQTPTILGSSAKHHCRKIIQSRLDLFTLYYGRVGRIIGLSTWYTVVCNSALIACGPGGAGVYIGQEDWGRKALSVQLWLWGNTPFYWIKAFQMGLIVGETL